MNNEQALKLAAACEAALKTHGIMSAAKIYDVVKNDRTLYAEVPVSLATVSRSLRSLVRTRRAFFEVVKNEMRFSATPIKPTLTKKEKNALRELAKPMPGFTAPPYGEFKPTVIVHKPDDSDQSAQLHAQTQDATNGAVETTSANDES